VDKKPYRWEAWEVEELRCCYETMTSTDIAKCLGRSVIAVRRKATRLQIDSGLRAGCDTRIWTVAEERRLKELWGQGLPVRAIAERLSRTESSIRAHRWRLHLPRRHTGVGKQPQRLIVEHPWRRTVA
jgi:hypothetical protein